MSSSSDSSHYTSANEDDMVSEKFTTNIIITDDEDDDAPIITVRDLLKETLLEIKHPLIYTYANTHARMFWRQEEIPFDKDAVQFPTLPIVEQKMIRKANAFFLIADSVVGDTTMAIAEQIGDSSARSFYAAQNHIEQVHKDVYSRMFLACEQPIPGLTREHQLQLYCDEINTMKSILLKRKFCLAKNLTLVMMLLRNTFVEGIFFTTSFACMLWLKKRGKCEGVVKANEWILRDEALHWMFGCEVYKLLFVDEGKGVTQETIHDLATEAYNIECQFIDELIEEDFAEMTRKNMKTHLKHCINMVVEKLGVKPIFEPTESPFEFAKFLNYPVKANFFETRVTNYSLAVGDLWENNKPQPQFKDFTLSI